MTAPNSIEITRDTAVELAVAEEGETVDRFTVVSEGEVDDDDLCELVISDDAGNVWATTYTCHPENPLFHGEATVTFVEVIARQKTVTEYVKPSEMPEWTVREPGPCDNCGRPAHLTEDGNWVHTQSGVVFCPLSGRESYAERIAFPGHRAVKRALSEVLGVEGEMAWAGLIATARGAVAAAETYRHTAEAAHARAEKFRAQIPAASSIVLDRPTVTQIPADDGDSVLKVLVGADVEIEHTGSDGIESGIAVTPADARQLAALLVLAADEIDADLAATSGEDTL